MRRLPIPLLPSADAVLNSLDAALRTVRGATVAARARPHADAGQLPEMSEADRQRSGALMRVNHVGEVCAQALYQAQALTARTAVQQQQMLDAARDEVDHLAWTQERLRELDDRPSLLNPLWYAGSFAIGLAAGTLGDRVSLGFMAETERQVEAHLASHLERLPASDGASRAIVDQMKIDEARHAQHAEDTGAARLPMPVRALMTLAAKVMTTIAHRI